MDIFIDPSFSRYYQQYPLVLVDIGARGGLQKHWRPAEKYLQVIAFEPDPQEFKRLVNSADPQRIKYLNTALYKEKATLDFHLTKSPGSSSIFKANRPFRNQFPDSEASDIVRTVQLEADTLDHQFQLNAIGEADFIKLDTEDSELCILQGATNTLQHSIFGLEIEVNFAPLYENQLCFAEVDSFVRKFGFHLFDLRRQYAKRQQGRLYGGPKGQLWQGDALYLRDFNNFYQMLGQLNTKDTWLKSKVLRAISICILYGYLDYALEIFETAADLFTTPEKTCFMQKVKRETRRLGLLPDWPLKYKLVSLFLYPLCRWHNRLYTQRGWATSDRHLGNFD